MLRVLLDEGLAACRGMRRVFAGGEALGADLQTAFFAVQDAETDQPLRPDGDDDRGHLLAMRARAGVAHRRCSGPSQIPERPPARCSGPGWSPARWGCRGSCSWAACGVRRGYLSRAAETASSFLPDPFAAAPGERLYRTGDRVAPPSGRPAGVPGPCGPPG